MRAEIVNVTPQIAADWLSRNTCNRPLRRTVVEGLKSAFLRGEYVQTHQGVAFSINGELLDGQHRLTAISELRDGVFPMLVTADLTDDAFRVMDIGVKRTAADALRNDDRRIVECARLIAIIATSKRGSVTPTMLLPIIEAIDRVHGSLMTFCPTSAKTWSSAPVRLAAVMTIMGGADGDYVRMIYRALVLSDFDAMPPVVRALYKSHVNGHVRAADVGDMIARCLIAFSARKANVTKVQVKDSSAALAQVRQLFGYLIEREDEDEADKKKATPKGAAKSVLPFHYSQLPPGR